MLVDCPASLDAGRRAAARGLDTPQPSTHTGDETNYWEAA
jgi:hypothetical protein